MELEHQCEGARAIYKSIQPRCECAGHSELKNYFGCCTTNSSPIPLIGALIESPHQYRGARTIQECVQACSNCAGHSEAPESLARLYAFINGPCTSTLMIRSY